MSKIVKSLRLVADQVLYIITADVPTTPARELLDKYPYLGLGL